MRREPSFSDRIKQGWSKEQLLQHYALTEAQYEKALACLNNLKQLETSKKENPKKGERDHIEAVGKDEVKRRYEQLPEHGMEFSEAFGEEPEEA